MAFADSMKTRKKLETELYMDGDELGIIWNNGAGNRPVCY